MTTNLNSNIASVPINNNFKAFQKKAVPAPVMSSNALDNSQNAQENKQSGKNLLKDKYTKAKLKVVNVFKGFNNIKDVSQGVVKGVAGGASTVLAVGVVGKNIKNTKNFNLFGIISGVAKDLSGAVYSAFKFIPDLFTKPLVEDLKNILGLAPKFYTKYMVNNKGIAALATICGLSVFAFNVLKGKINANRDNANVDHSVNTGHIPTKIR